MGIYVYRELIHDLVEDHIDAHGYYSEGNQRIPITNWKLKSFTVAIENTSVFNIRVGFVNNGVIALFESARYLIYGKEIESIERKVDVATTIIWLARYSDDYTRSAGPSMMFAKDTSTRHEHIQYSRVKATGDTAVDPAQAGCTRPAAAFDVINNVPNFNLAFATRVGSNVARTATTVFMGDSVASYILIL